jgi:hypothetical protein
MAPTRCCWGNFIVIARSEATKQSILSLPRSALRDGLLRFARNDGQYFRHGLAFPRRDAPEACMIVSPSEIRGRREDRVRAAPAVSCARLHKGGIRPSLRNGFTAYFVLSPVNRLCCHRRHADRSTQLDASIGAPGPHDFAVRISRARQSQLPRPPHPTARFVTIASRPSHRVRRAESNH